MEKVTGSADDSIVDDIVRDEMHHAFALSGSVHWGISSGRLLRPLPARRPGGRAFRVFRAA